MSSKALVSAHLVRLNILGMEDPAEKLLALKQFKLDLGSYIILRGARHSKEEQESFNGIMEEINIKLKEGLIK